MQPDPSLVQEPQAEVPAPQEPPVAEVKPRLKKPIFKIVILVLLVFAVAGLGYWNYQLSANLKAAQQSLATLQGKHDNLTAQKNQLTSDFEKASSDLAQAKTELESTNATLSTAKSDLSKSKGDEKALREKMDRAGQYIEIMRGIFVDEDVNFVTYLKIVLVKDGKLDSLFQEYMASGSYGDLVEWLAHLLSTVEGLLK